MNLTYLILLQVDLCKQLVDQLDSNIVPDKDYIILLQVDLCKQLVDQLDSNIVPDKDYIIAGVLAKSG